MVASGMTGSAAKARLGTATPAAVTTIISRREISPICVSPRLFFSFYLRTKSAIGTFVFVRLLT
jgi:hypothetical protein